jgi:hypothetical protein
VPVVFLSADETSLLGLSESVLTASSLTSGVTFNSTGLTAVSDGFVSTTDWDSTVFDFSDFDSVGCDSTGLDSIDLASTDFDSTGFDSTGFESSGLDARVSDSGDSGCTDFVSPLIDSRSDFVSAGLGLDFLP